MKKTLLGMSRIYVENMISIWMTNKFRVVEKLSNNDESQNEALPTKYMSVVRDNGKNVLDCCCFESICVVVSIFLKLSKNILTGGLTFSLSTSRDIKIG